MKRKYHDKGLRRAYADGGLVGGAIGFLSNPAGSTLRSAMRSGPLVDLVEFPQPPSPPEYPRPRDHMGLAQDSARDALPMELRPDFQGPPQFFKDRPDDIGLARGGIVRGPGGPREDKVPMEIAGVPVKLSNEEAVLPARTVDALGGSEAVERLIERTNGRPPERMGLRAGGRYAGGATFTIDPDGTVREVRPPPSGPLGRPSLPPPQAGSTGAPPPSGAPTPPPSGGTPNSATSRAWEGLKKAWTSPAQSTWEATKSTFGVGKEATGAAKRVVDKVLSHPGGVNARGAAGAALTLPEAGEDIGKAWGRHGTGETNLLGALGTSAEALGNLAVGGLLARGGRGLGGVAANLIPMNALGMFDEDNRRPVTNAMRLLGMETGITRQEAEIAERDRRDNELATGTVRVAPKQSRMSRALDDAKSFNDTQSAALANSSQAATRLAQSPQELQREGEARVLVSQGLPPELVRGAQGVQAASGQAASTVNPINGIPNAASIQLPEGYGMATGPGRDGLRRAILLGPQRNADGSPASRWEDGARYKEQMAVNERMSRLARQMERDRYGRDLQGDVLGTHARQAAITNLNRMDLEDAVARQERQFGEQLGLRRAMVDRQSQADAANAYKSQFEMQMELRRDEREDRKVRADEAARREKGVQDAVTQASLSVPEEQREDFIRKAEANYGDILRSLPSGEARARMQELAVNYLRDRKVRENSLTQPSTTPFVFDRARPYQIRDLVSKNISVPSWLKAVLTGQRVAVGKDGTVVPLDIILDNVFDKDGNLMRGKANEMAEVVRLQTPGASR